MHLFVLLYALYMYYCIQSTTTSYCGEPRFFERTSHFLSTPDNRKNSSQIQYLLPSIRHVAVLILMENPKSSKLLLVNSTKLGHD